MKIDKSMILRAVPEVFRPRLNDFVSTFNEYSDVFGIDTPLRAAHYLAQVFYESTALSRTEENMNYSQQRLLQVFPKYFNKATADMYAHNPQKTANRVYANRMGNGSEASGDGYRFRGRGFLQLTGKAGYQAYAKSGYCVGDLMSHPEWLSQFPGAQKASMWYWNKHNINRWADDDNAEGVTRSINGGLNGLAQRKFYLRRFKKVLGV